MRDIVLTNQVLFGTVNASRGAFEAAVRQEELMRFHLDEEARVYINAVLAETIRDPIGPEFMAPPERPLEVPAQPGSPV